MACRQPAHDQQQQSQGASFQAHWQRTKTTDKKADDWLGADFIGHRLLPLNALALSTSVRRISSSVTWLRLEQSRPSRDQALSKKDLGARGEIMATSH